MMRTISAAAPAALAGAAAAWFLVFFLHEPVAAWKAASSGMAVWRDVLFPALLPFLVVAELMVGLGVVHFFGTLFDPLMRPLFRVPGAGGFIMAMGLASGYPVGARLTARLRDQGWIGRTEAERLVAFTTSSDPIFLAGAVAIGFFGDARTAATLAVAHYGACLLVGLAMRFYGPVRDSPRDPEPSPTVPNAPESANRRQAPLVVRAFRAMHEARAGDPRPPGRLLEDAVASALRLVFVIGGLVVLFSVLMEALRAAGILRALEAAVGAALRVFDASDAANVWPQALAAGLFEVTWGCKTAGEAAAPVADRVAAAAAVLSWAGLSVHAQVMSLISRTGCRYTPFLLARLLHAALAAALVYTLGGAPTTATGASASGLPVAAFDHASDFPGGTPAAVAAASTATALLLAGTAFAIVGTLRLGARVVFGRRFL